MANDWLRLWHDMPNDPKWRSIAKASGQHITAVMSVYIHMLVCASNATERGRTQGWSEEDIANALDMEISQVSAICDAMQGRVLDGDLLKGWKKRQPAREDGSAERSKAWREDQKHKKAQESPPRTQPNATERNRPIDTDTDKDTERETRARDPHTDFENLEFQGEFVAVAAAEGLSGDPGGKCWRKFKVHFASRPPQDSLQAWKKWVLDERKPPATGIGAGIPASGAKPLTIQEEAISRLGSIHWKRKQRGEFISQADSKFIADYEAQKGAVWWVNLQQWREADGKPPD